MSLLIGVGDFGIGELKEQAEDAATVAVAAKEEVLSSQGRGGTFGTVAFFRSTVLATNPAVIQVIDAGREGTFRYDSTDTVSADDGILIIVGPGGRRYKRVWRGEVTLAMVPADQNGDRTVAMQRILNAPDVTTFTFAPGLYDGIGRVTQRPNTTVLLAAGATIKARVLTSTELIAQSNSEYDTPVWMMRTGCKLSGKGTIDANKSERKGGRATIGGVANVKTWHGTPAVAGLHEPESQISGIRITNADGSGIWFHGSHRSSFSKLRIDTCDFVGIEGVISNDIAAEGNKITSCAHGIQWWGSDVEGYCEDWTVTGNQISNIAGGGIWGNRGRRISVTGGNVRTCNDIGVDFEQCEDSTATGVTVKDCKVSALAVYSCKRIIFSGCIVSQSGVGDFDGWGFKSNLGTAGENTDISLIGCNIKTVGKNGVYADAGSLISNLRIFGGSVTTTANQPIYFTDCPGGAVIGCRVSTGSIAAITVVGGTNVQIRGNTLVYTGSTPADARPVRLIFRTNESRANYSFVSDNICSGFSGSMLDDNWGNGASFNTFERNRGVTAISATVMGGYTGRWYDNRNGVGTVIDGSHPDGTGGGGGGGSTDLTNYYTKSQTDGLLDGRAPLATTYNKDAVDGKLDLKINLTQKGAANGVATLGGDGKVPAGQLPSYVDDILEFDLATDFPTVGESGKIYVVKTGIDANKQYRWSGSTYVLIVSSPGTSDAVTEGSTNRYFTENRVLTTLLTGITFVTNRAIVAGDNLLVALGLLQKQITDLGTAKANLASPALSGTPTAPTATAGTSTTQVATTAFVATAVAAGGGGGTNDASALTTGTLNDARLSANVVLKDATQILTNKTLASPALTGTPSATTPPTGDDSTRLATTGWVKDQGYGSAVTAAEIDADYVAIYKAGRGIQ